MARSYRVISFFYVWPGNEKKQYRLPGYDYSSAGAYFITVVCKGRASWFGDIQLAELTLTPIGIYLEHLIAGLSDKINWCSVEEYQLMPNHLHIILLINEHDDNKNWKFAEGLQPLHKKSLSSFANHLKGKLKRWCNEQGYTYFEWQERFHDRVIRDEKEHAAIKKYVQHNIENWRDDNEILPAAPDQS